MDEVTHWQVVACTPRISEGWLQPVLEALLQQFPFHIRGFHSDNGSEFINATVHANRIQRFYREHFNPYLNFHRPCGQADIDTDDKGRQRRRYRRYQTQLETLLALSNPEQYLRSGVTLATLERLAHAMSDTEAARRMQQAKRKLFEELRRSV